MNSETANLKNSLRIIASLGWITFREIIRDKVLYNGILVGMILLGSTYLASRLSFVQQSRIALDFGVSVLTLACVGMSILLAAPLFQKEIEKRTILVTLAKPISRFHFLFGKALGLFLTLFVNWVILCVVFLTVFALVGGNIHSTLILALFFILIQTFLAGALTLLFSTFSTTSLSAMMGFGMYLVGMNISQIEFLANKAEVPAMKNALTGLTYILPNFENFSLGIRTTYGLPVEFLEIVKITGYGLFIVLFFTVLSGVFFGRKDI